MPLRRNDAPVRSHLDETLLFGLRSEKRGQRRKPVRVDEVLLQHRAGRASKPRCRGTAQKRRRRFSLWVRATNALSLASSSAGISPLPRHLKWLRQLSLTRGMRCGGALVPRSGGRPVERTVTESVGLEESAGAIAAQDGHDGSGFGNGHQVENGR